MIMHNQFKLQPGVYQHYKGGLYVVETIVNYCKVDGVWTKMHDPEVVYRNLEPQYESINGVKQWVIKNFKRKLSEFQGTVDVEGQTINRFTPV